MGPIAKAVTARVEEYQDCERMDWYAQDISRDYASTVVRESIRDSVRMGGKRMAFAGIELCERIELDE